MDDTGAGVSGGLPCWPDGWDVGSAIGWAGDGASVIVVGAEESVGADGDSAIG